MTVEVGDVVRLRNMRRYFGPPNPESDTRLEYVTYSTKGTDAEYVSVFLGTVPRDKHVTREQVDGTLLRLGYVRVESLEELDLTDEQWAKLGFERVVPADPVADDTGEEE